MIVRVMTVAIAAACLTSVCTSAQAKTLAPGIKAGAIYTQDYFQNVHGGRTRGGRALSILQLNMGVNGRSWGGSRHNRFHLQLLGTFGGSISNKVGDVQGLDNIEAYNTFKVFSAWYQHTFGDSGVRVRLGMQDYAALFDTTSASLVFINSSFGLGGAIAQSDVSTYPTTTLGGVLSWQARNGVYAMAGLYNGMPGAPGHPAGTHLYFGSRDGVFAAAETGVKGGSQRPYKIGFGGWYQTTRYRDFAGRSRNSNHGEYLIAQTRLYGGGSKPAVDGFVQLGAAQADANMLNRYVGLGVNIQGLVPGRSQDVFGLGMARVHTVHGYRRITADASHAETTVEMTYQSQLTRYAMIQPDIQYIIDPGASHATPNALVIGLRGQLSW